MEPLKSNWQILHAKWCPLRATEPVSLPGGPRRGRPPQDLGQKEAEKAGTNERGAFLANSSPSAFAQISLSSGVEREPRPDRSVWQVLTMCKYPAVWNIAKANPSCESRCDTLDPPFSGAVATGAPDRPVFVCAAPRNFLTRQELGWNTVEEEGGREPWHLFWTDMSVSTERAMKMKHFQRKPMFNPISTPFGRLRCDQDPLHRLLTHRFPLHRLLTHRFHPVTLSECSCFEITPQDQPLPRNERNCQEIQPRPELKPNGTTNSPQLHSNSPQLHSNSPQLHLISPLLHSPMAPNFTPIIPSFTVF